MVMQPAPISHPYGTLPAMPQMSIGNAGSSPSVQYGISSLPVGFFFFGIFNYFIEWVDNEGSEITVSMKFCDGRLFD